MLTELPSLTVVIPAAGVGKRMQANIAKQYLTIHQDYVLDHTLAVFIDLPFVTEIMLVVSEQDPYFEKLKHAGHPKVKRVAGGAERANSVFNGIKAIREYNEWVMVHDAARPCLKTQDIIKLYQTCLNENSAGILATPVRDTMKRAESGANQIITTVDRSDLWHALTPQCAKVTNLSMALEQQRNSQGAFSASVTDEASALELAGEKVLLVEGSAKNIKITHPEDLHLAEFYLQYKQENTDEF